jgi:hypothetical protein
MVTDPFGNSCFSNYLLPDSSLPISNELIEFFNYEKWVLNLVLFARAFRKPGSAKDCDNL